MGNDVEDEESGPAPMPREVVKKTTSSKKSDVAPASADPAKAKKAKKPVGGNEGALKSKADNKATPGPAATPSKHEKKAFDRHSRTAKTDSKKKVRQGWGDDRRELEYETRGAADAAAEQKAEAEGVAAPAGKSLQEYLKEKAEAETALGGSRAVRQANAGSDKWAAASEKIEKEQQAYVGGSSAKKIKQKAGKEKKFLDINAVFADEGPKFEKKSYKGKKPAAADAGKKEQNFPSL